MVLSSETPSWFLTSRPRCQGKLYTELNTKAQKAHGINVRCASSCLLALCSFSNWFSFECQPAPLDGEARQVCVPWTGGLTSRLLQRPIWAPQCGRFEVLPSTGVLYSSPCPKLWASICVWLWVAHFPWNFPFPSLTSLNPRPLTSISGEETEN